MRLITTPLLIVAAFVLGGMIFKSSAPTQCATILPRDSIFVLTGDARRIPFAMRKLREHPDAKLYIIGVGGGGNFTNENIVLESGSKNTLQNAAAIEKIARENALDRIVLITTVDHYNRARYLIHEKMPDLEIAACPAALNGMPAPRRLERWTTEYLKYIGTLIGIRES
ncbi:MAG: YdcF family protein [Rickettsiales bacterium]|jgi:uncharacterized SAM-binding protein YcdF (DUF218 family)|nr:YdcF family protein [Rickettsiales bacterium]